jgi:predicted metalloprotease with PDZ domain
VSTGNFPLAEARRLLAHEYMHTWIPIMLGGMPALDEAKDYWFSEGFADYLAGKILLRARLWTLKDFISDKNAALLRYGLSPARRATDTEVAEGIWFDKDIQQLNYDRGHLIAALLEAEIGASTGGREGLGEVLRAQRRSADGSPELATTLLARMLKERTGLDLDALAGRYARRGEPLLLPPGVFGDCAKVVAEPRRLFDRGFDAAATRSGGGVIAGVDPEGPAHAAGLRDGMKLVLREAGKIGDSSVEIAYRIADEGGERVLRYMPEGKESREVQQIVLTTEGPEAEARCLKRFADLPQ